MQATYKHNAQKPEPTQVKGALYCVLGEDRIYSLLICCGFFFLSTSLLQYNACGSISSRQPVCPLMYSNIQHLPIPMENQDAQNKQQTTTSIETGR